MSDALKRMQSIVAKFKLAKDSAEQIVALLEESLNIVLESPSFHSVKETYQYFCKEFTLTLFSTILKIDYRNVNLYTDY